MCLVSYFRTLKQCVFIFALTDSIDTCEENQALPVDNSQISYSSRFETVVYYMWISSVFNQVIVSVSAVIDS